MSMGSLPFPPAGQEAHTEGLPCELEPVGVAYFIYHSTLVNDAMKLYIVKFDKM